MADLAKKNANKMINAVGALIDIVLTDNTTPSRSQVVEWLNEGVIECIRVLPVKELQDMYTSYSSTTGTINEVDLPRPCHKVISLFRNEVSCIEVDENVFNSIRDTQPYKFTVKNPAYVKRIIDGNINFQTYPGGRSLLRLVYIPTPFVYATGDNQEEAEVPTTYSIPIELEPYVLSYAAAMARVQDEEPAQFQLYKQDWMNMIRAAHGLPISPADGS